MGENAVKSFHVQVNTSSCTSSDKKHHCNNTVE